MTQSPAVRTTGRSGPVRIGERAARTLVAELARINDPKAALLVGVTPDSAVLAAAVDALLPGDRLTVVPAEPFGAAALREHVTAQGRWVADRVSVVDSLAEAEAAGVVIAGEAFTGTAEATRSGVEGLAKYLTDGAVLSVATVATPGRTEGAAAELARQDALYGVGADLVLRNSPPVRVYRLRFTPASPATADTLAPAYRPSSVPVTRGMHIDSNGVAAAGIALSLAALARVARPSSKLWLLPALAAGPVAAFFRDPERDVPEDPSAVVASADGKVLSVQRLHDERFGDGEWLRIAVFLSVLDVHVNRAPVAGKVVDYFVADGGFVNAMKPDAEHNVAAYTVLDTARGTVVVAQRTGLIARRIVQRAPIGALLAKGERFGLIRFGSRTDVYLPAEAADPLVGPGDKVVGGSTVIARWR
ncbi:Phosphatidylserine decarboxylase [Micromonospora saelicesensis]|uniref:Phosphatidylserine decarboxylase n=1 Tax=Micromonospora saelicesensis TaxID=285676 RepID=A0A328NR48_9ACTN|nr:phosphatidylserine decarboxylase [Micromonospora saelicesensis]RAN95938.1 Phosphatidylserine decarboxylase [Micromonospora saelicesensis]RAO36148.1 Phosphatidylserine decarboxylase [Micromonospora saelicesensis]RAO40069.1 Phosphatidylserine decarboxylase [Micromonospora saelicesensis]RAO58943.1 Phosphatidylserine decarboxylase [Micromonospora saelicesensis]